MAMTEPVRDKEKIKELINYYRSRGQICNYALIVMGIHTALRISDAYVKHKLKNFQSFL